MQTRLNVILLYMKAYYVPSAVCVGIFFNSWMIAAVNHCSWKRTNGHWPVTFAAVGNIAILIFRGSINYWWGDGLYFSTYGTAYVYLEQLSGEACKAIRSLSCMFELVPISVTIYETATCYNKFFSRNLGPNKTLVALVFYSLAASSVAVVTSCFAFEIIAHDTTLVGKACAFHLTPLLNQCLVLLTAAVVYAMPSLTVTCLVLTIVVLRKTRFGVAKMRVSEITSHDKLVIAKALAYAFLLFPISVCLCLRVANVQMTGHDSHSLQCVTIFMFLLPLILPTFDFFAMFGFLQDFRSSVRAVVC